MSTHLANNLIGKSNTTLTYSPTFVLTAGNAFGRLLKALLNCFIVSFEIESSEDMFNIEKLPKVSMFTLRIYSVVDLCSRGGVREIVGVVLGNLSMVSCITLLKPDYKKNLI